MILNVWTDLGKQCGPRSDIEQSDQGVHYLPFSLHLLDGNDSFSNFRVLTANEPPHDKTNKMVCVLSKDSDQPGHLPSLIRVSAVRSMDS